jgi:hypothetical protein
LKRFASGIHPTFLPSQIYGTLIRAEVSTISTPTKSM